MCIFVDVMSGLPSVVAVQQTVHIGKRLLSGPAGTPGSAKPTPIEP